MKTLILTVLLVVLALPALAQQDPPRTLWNPDTGKFQFVYPTPNGNWRIHDPDTGGNQYIYQMPPVNRGSDPPPLFRRSR